VILQRVRLLFVRLEWLFHRHAVLGSHNTQRNLAQFPSLREVNVEVDRLPEYGELLRNLNKEFDLRFVDFKKTAADMELFSPPFSVSPDLAPEHLQMELIEFQCDTELRRKFVSLPLRDFYPHVSVQRYPQMRKNAQVMLSLFGSTYICEQTFSLMNLNKIKLRGTLTDSHCAVLIGRVDFDATRRKKKTNPRRFFFLTL
uniref:HAT C-terminal dimerisation domain-containing protein n=1 Tax=Oryzias latipes TaxID=8090 RepID=A0A3P9LFQ4_ORYLA